MVMGEFTIISLGRNRDERTNNRGIKKNRAGL